MRGNVHHSGKNKLHSVVQQAQAPHKDREEFFYFISAGRNDRRLNQHPLDRIALYSTLKTLYTAIRS